MNNTEARYAQLLELDPEVAWWRYEGAKFRLATRTWYTPDFLVMKSNGALEAHEVKGYWRDDARVKIKAAAANYPIPFFAASWRRKNWEIEEITP